MLNKLTLILLLVLCSSGLYAADSTISRSYYMSQDSWIEWYLLTPTGPFGDLDTMLIAGGLADKRLVMQLTSNEMGDLNDSLDSDWSSIDEALINVRLKKDVGIAGATDIEARPLAREINQDYATWDYYDDGLEWTTDGAAGAGDTIAGYVYTFDLDDTTNDGWCEIDVTAFYAAVVAGTVADAYGWRINAVDEAANVKTSYYTQNQSGTSNDPYFTIDGDITLPSIPTGLANIHGKPDIMGKPNIHGVGR